MKIMAFICQGLILAFLLYCSVSQAAVGEPEFFPLLPDGGGVWMDRLGTHLAIHPLQNRLYSIASSVEGYRLIQRDSVTGAVIATYPSSAQMNGYPLDVKVWAEGNEVLTLWGRILGSERVEGVALERFNLNTGLSVSFQSEVRFLVFDVDQDVAWGIIEDETAGHYAIASMNLPGGIIQAATLSIPRNDAIVRDFALNASTQTAVILFQPARVDDPDRVVPEGFILLVSLVTLEETARVDIPDGNYRLGGMALDRERNLLYTLPQDGGSLGKVDLSSPEVASVVPESGILAGYQAGGAVAIHAPTGRVFLANDADTQIEQRVLLAEIGDGTAEVMGLWTSGADPSRLLYDERLDRVYAASYPSQSLTAIHPSQPDALFQAPMSILSHDFIYDALQDRLMLLSRGGEIYLFDPADARLVDKIESIGLLPDVGIVLDSRRERFWVGTFGQASPVVYDARSLAQQGTLARAGSALAVASEQGHLFQTGIAFPPSSPIYIYSATDGNLQEEVAESLTFGRTRKLVVDEERNLLYGISGSRSATLGPGIWAYNYLTGQSIELGLPQRVWSYFDHLILHPPSGRISVVGYSQGYYLLIFDPADFDEPAHIIPLSSFQNVLDSSMDPQSGGCFIYGQRTEEGSPLLGIYSMNGNGELEEYVLNLPSLPARMALDTRRGNLWLSSEKPSGLYRIPLNRASKPVPIKNLQLEITPRKGRNELRWSMDFTPGEDDSIRLLRQDGALAEFIPLFLDGLPGSATGFDDVNMIPQAEYTYRVEVCGASALAEVVTAEAGEEQPVIARPLSQVSRLPQGGTASVSVIVEGRFYPTRSVTIQVDETSMSDESGLSVLAIPAILQPPGVFQLQIQSSAETPAGRYPFQVFVHSDEGTQSLWLIAEVFVPYSDVLVDGWLASTSRFIHMHTDTRIQNETDFQVVLKGEIGALKGVSGSTGLIVRYDPGDGRIRERRDVLANNGYFSIGIPIEESHGIENVLRAQITWLGSGNSPGGVSPVLTLPRVQDSVSGSMKNLNSASRREEALFALGDIPSIGHPPVSATDMLHLLGDVEQTLLADFTPEKRMVMSKVEELESALQQAENASTLLIYAAGDTRGGALQMGGQALSPQDMAAYLHTASAGQAIVIMEGLHSGSFTDAAIPYPEGVTVIASSSLDDRNNLLHPWEQSFSARFMNQVRKGRSLIQSFHLAQASFLDPFAGQLQNPRLLRGNALEMQLGKRFIAAELPDLVPPEILDIRIEASSQPGEAIVEVLAADNRDTSHQITIEAKLASWSGKPLSQVVFSPPAQSVHYHRGFITLPDAHPGVGLSLWALDRSGNQSPQLNLWLAKSGHLFYDANSDQQVDANDLLQWFHRIQNDEFELYDHWLYDFATQWMEAR